MATMSTPHEAAGESAHAERRGLLAALGLALLVAVPSALGTGLYGDDYWQLVALERGAPLTTHLADLFRFFDGDPEHLRQLMNDGPVPWFTHAELKLAMWRPLSAATHVLDHALFGVDPLGGKIHSVLWYLALVVGVGLLFRRTIPGRTAALGLIVFAVAATHREPVAWLGSRNALITATLGVYALLAHLRWRQDGWQPGRLLSVVGFPTALLAGEGALGAVAYLVAYEWVAGPGDARRRVLAAAPGVAAALLWLAAYYGQGYGTYGGGAYQNPLLEPLNYLMVLPERIVGMFGIQFLGVPADLWFFLPGFRPWMIALGTLTIGLLAWLLPPVWRSATRERRTAMLWLALGAVGAMAPQAAGWLGPRSFTLPSVGGSALLAALFVHTWDRAAAARSSEVSRSRRLAIACCAVLAAMHLVVAPLSWYAWSWLHRDISLGIDRVLSASDLHDQELSGQRVVLIQAPDPYLGFFVPFMREIEGLPNARSWWTLSAAQGAHRVHRTGADTLEVEVLDGRMLVSPAEQMVRSREFALREGDEVHLDGLSVRVLRVEGGAPTHVEFRFERSLDDPGYRVLAWRDGRLQRIALPAEGRSMTLPWKPGPGTI